MANLYFFRKLKHIDYNLLVIMGLVNWLVSHMLKHSPIYMGLIQRFYVTFMHMDLGKKVLM